VRECRVVLGSGKRGGSDQETRKNSTAYDAVSFMRRILTWMALRLTIAIDGPAGSGKSTVAARVAGMLDCLSGQRRGMYRAVALKALERRVPLEDEIQNWKIWRAKRI